MSQHSAWRIGHGAEGGRWEANECGIVNAECGNIILTFYPSIAVSFKLVK